MSPLRGQPQSFRPDSPRPLFIILPEILFPSTRSHLCSCLCAQVSLPAPFQFHSFSFSYSFLRSGGSLMGRSPGERWGVVPGLGRKSREVKLGFLSPVASV